MDRALFEKVAFGVPKRVKCVRPLKDKFASLEVNVGTPIPVVFLRIVCAVVASILILWAVSQQTLTLFNFISGGKFSSWTDFKQQLDVDMDRNGEKNFLHY